MSELKNNFEIALSDDEIKVFGMLLVGQKAALRDAPDVIELITKLYKKVKSLAMPDILEEFNNMEEAWNVVVDDLKENIADVCKNTADEINDLTEGMQRMKKSSMKIIEDK